MSWSVMLAGALPVAGFVAYWRPFSALAARLSLSGAALCGWRGARELADPFCLAVTDRDLFPQGSVTMNGLKVFNNLVVSQVVGYAYAVIAKSGSGLEPVFREAYINQNGRAYNIDAFRRYEGGGLGAEVQGEVILVGSIGFMRAMGVRMEEGTNVQRAVYCAINGELAAVFALNYNPSPSVRSGLHAALRGRKLSLLLATRDFMLTPSMVCRKYKISSENVEYPSVEERTRLSGPYASEGGTQAALLARDSFLSISEAVSGGQALCGSVRAGLVVDLLGGCLGLLVAALLAWGDGFASASAANLMLFCSLWTLPALLLGTLAGK